MKLLTFPTSRAPDRPQLWLLGLVAGVTFAGLITLAHPLGPFVVYGGIAAAALGVAATSLRPGSVLLIYLGYLMFEGAFKILSNYHLALRFGSDLLLAFAFLRLMARFQREGNPDVSEQQWKSISVVGGLLLVFWLWVALQFLNPWGLGLLPSLAGLKVYLLPVLVFFGVTLMARNDEIRFIPPLLLGLGILQAAVSVVDWTYGLSGLPALHPKYNLVYWDFLKGYPYRPFGTTNLPGAPALWMFHCLGGALLFLFLSRGRKQKWAGVGLALFVLLGLATLVACQVRLSLIRFSILLVGGLALMGRKSILVAVGAGALVVSVISVDTGIDPNQLLLKTQWSTLDRLKYAVDRLGTLRNAQDWKSARGGSWAWEALKTRASVTGSGIGLSRVGASAAPWLERIDQDRHFGRDWSFADNLPLALFTELGFGGLLTYLTLAVSVIWVVVRTPGPAAKLCAIYCGLVFGSGLGSEGILFQPDASFFWLMAALGIRSQGLEAAA